MGVLYNHDWSIDSDVDLAKGKYPKIACHSKVKTILMHVPLWLILVVVKPGVPEDNELHHLANDVCLFWKKLGRELGVEESKLSQLELDYQQDAYERAFQMFLHWKQTRHDQATYQILFNALTVVGRNDLGKAYCESTWECTKM